MTIQTKIIYHHFQSMFSVTLERLVKHCISSICCFSFRGNDCLLQVIMYLITWHRNVYMLMVSENIPSTLHVRSHVCRWFSLKAFIVHFIIMEHTYSPIGLEYESSLQSLSCGVKSYNPDVTWMLARLEQMFSNTCSNYFSEMI